MNAIDTKSVNKVCTCLGSAKSGLSLTNVKRVECPRGLKNDCSAVFHYDKSECRILDSEVIGIPVAPHITLIGILVELVVSSTYTVLGLIVVHSPKSEVKSVSSDVYERTAALLVLVEEHTPVRNCSTTDSRSLSIIYLTENAIVCLGLEVNRIVTETVLVTYGELLAGSVCSIDHLLCLSRVYSHRLLTHNVLSCLKSVNCNKAVRTVRSTYVNNLNALVSKKILVVLVSLCVGCTELCSRSLSSLKHDITESNDLAAIDCSKSGKMLSVCDASASNNSNFYVSFHNF